MSSTLSAGADSAIFFISFPSAASVLAIGGGRLRVRFYDIHISPAHGRVGGRNPSKVNIEVGR